MGKRWASFVPRSEVEDVHHPSTLKVISRRRILYWRAVMVAVLIVGTIIGLIWADTSDVAGAIAVVTNTIGVVGIVVLLVALGMARRVRGVRVC